MRSGFADGTHGIGRLLAWIGAGGLSLAAASFGVDSRERPGFGPETSSEAPIADSASERPTESAASSTAHRTEFERTSVPQSWRPRGSGRLSVDLDWYWAVFGYYIGSAGMDVADLDADGDLELIATARLERTAQMANYFYVVEDVEDGYGQTLASVPFDAGIQRLEVGQADDDAALEIVLVTGEHLAVFDSRSFELELQIELAPWWKNGLVIGQMDADSAIEAAVCSSHDTWIYDLGSGLEQLVLFDLGCVDIDLGETDGTPGPELVITNPYHGWVLDSATGAVEWDHAPGFGGDLELADFDGDGRDEIASAFWLVVQVWNGESRSQLWDYQGGNVATLSAADLDGDGEPELICGQSETGSVTVVEGSTGTVLWSVQKPGFGMTRVAAGDVDGDATGEIFFGVDLEVEDDNYLFAVDANARAIDWTSRDIRGPFPGLAFGDVDADGEPELLFASARSGTFSSGDGLYFVHDAHSLDLEYSSPEPTGANWTGLWKVEVGQIDNDPRLEIFLGTGVGYTGQLQCRDGASHHTQWVADLEPGASVASLEMADVISGGAPEIVLGTAVHTTEVSGPRLQLRDATHGGLLWQSPTLEAYFGGLGSLGLLRVGNVDGDPALEIVVAQEFGGILGLDAVDRTIEFAAADARVTALDIADLDGNGVAEVVVGTELGWIRLLDPETGNLFDLAGPYEGPVFGLTVREVVGSRTQDFVFASGDAVHVVDGGSLTVEWTSGDVGLEVGRFDGLLVDDVDEDGETEIWVSAGGIGHLLFSIRARLFVDDFESGDLTRWSSTFP